MKELVSAQLVVEESAEQFAFRHALTRQAIYTQLLARERSLLHRSIAETMEQFPAASLDAHLEDLAYHFYQARVWSKALDYVRRAGEKVLRLYSHRAAIDYFTWGLEAADHLSHPSSLLPHTRPLSPAHAPKQAFGGLTAREREVAILIAQGKSNQAIAETLVVTKRTVETHIGNIMFKLGCTSRTQIAVWAVETGLIRQAETEFSRRQP
jgi:DNA-binding CsgD family transcriptional regulator